MASKKTKAALLTPVRIIKAIVMMDHGKSLMKYEKNKLKRKSKMSEKGKVTLINNFENNVPSETKRLRYLTGTEEIKAVRCEWFKDAVSRRIIIIDQELPIREGP